jgi:chitodextrinase
VTVAPTDELGRTFDVQTYRFGGTADTTPPSVPTGLKASASASSVALTWTPSTDNVGVRGYRVLRNGVRIATVTGPSYVDTTVSPSTTYRYRVKAFDAAGNVSAASSRVIVTTLAH